MPVADPWGAIGGRGGYVLKTDFVASDVAELLADRLYSPGRFFFSFWGFDVGRECCCTD